MQRLSVTLKEQNVERRSNLGKFLGWGKAITLATRFRIQYEERANRTGETTKCAGYADPNQRRLQRECSGLACSVRMLIDERGVVNMKRINNYEISNLYLNIRGLKIV